MNNPDQIKYLEIELNKNPDKDAVFKLAKKQKSISISEFFQKKY